MGLVIILINECERCENYSELRTFFFILNYFKMLSFSNKGRIKLLPAKDPLVPEKRIHVGRDKMINKRLKLDGDDQTSEDTDDYVYNVDDTQPLRQQSNLTIPKRMPGMNLVLSKFTSLKFAGPRPVGCKQGGSQLGSTRRVSKVATALYDPNQEVKTRALI
jgi:hypothetical protein